MIIVLKIFVAYILFPALSYLLGSLSFGLIVGRMKGVDIRKEGSGNIGATNVLRVMGKGPAALVFALDVLKGAVPALFFALIAQAITGVPSWKLLGIIYGASTIFGHVYPYFFEFRGGKAVATSCGVFMVLAPLQTFTALMIWLTVLLFWKYVSLASMAGAASFLLMVLLLYPSAPVPPGTGFSAFFQNTMRAFYPVPSSFGWSEKGFMLVVSMAAVAVVFYRHRANIKRLREGTEPKIMTSKSDLRAAEAEKKFGKERLAVAGKRKGKVSVDALRSMSKPKKTEPEGAPATGEGGEKPADGSQPAGEQKPEGTGEAKPDGVAAPTAETPPAADAQSLTDTPHEGLEPPQEVNGDQVETGAPLEELDEITAENLELADDAGKSDTEETREMPGESKTDEKTEERSE